MNPLLEQFLAEASDLLAEVDAGLLHLEREPGDAELINVVFRAAHTIKGSSGLFDFPELTRLTHAGEDLLDAVRSGQLSLDSVMTDDLLAAFDLIRSWLTQVTVTERLPATAAAESADLITRLRAPTRGLTGEGDAADHPQPSREPTTSTAPAWLHALGEEWLRDTAEWLATTSASIRFARYTPDEDCYFRGEDPLNGVRQVPALDRLSLLQPSSWLPLDEYDEYACRVGFVFATRAAVSELAYLFRYVTDQIDIIELDAGALERLLDGGVDETVPDGAYAGTPDREGVDAPDREAQDVTDARTLLEGVVGALAAVGQEADRQTRLASAVIVADKAAGLLGQQPLSNIDDPADYAVEAQRLLALCPAPPTGAGSGKDRRTGPPERRLDGGETVDPVTEGGQVGNRTLKVDQEKVDRLMELAGELNVAKNSLTFLADAAEHEFGSRPLSRRIKDQYASMHRIAEELQAAVMDIRMLPFSVSYSRFPRLVRDLSRRLGKTVELVTDGEDTMADKDVIEALGDPLVHLVRNSLDHGIETPADRVLAGKPPQAQVRLTAVSDGDAVVVEVADDGRGIDPDKVRRKAYEKGLISEEQLDLIGDAEAVDLVFRPGFSLAAELTDVSGRGVGMDAVRASVERIGGTVTLRSRLGVGTSARLRMPLSMAVTQVVIISVAGQRFGVPVDLVQETVSVPVGELGRALHQQVLVLRGDVLPVLDLAELLDLPGSTPTADVRSVLIVKPGNHKIGLLVDGFDREVDVILKPMAGLLADTGTFSGTALLGDGLVLLILNLKEMLSRAAHAG